MVISYFLSLVRTFSAMPSYIQSHLVSCLLHFVCHCSITLSLFASKLFSIPYHTFHFPAHCANCWSDLYSVNFVLSASIFLNTSSQKMSLQQLMPKLLFSVRTFACMLYQCRFFSFLYMYYCCYPFLLLLVIFSWASAGSLS